MFWDVIAIIGGVVFLAIPVYFFQQTRSKLPPGRRFSEVFATAARSVRGRGNAGPGRRENLPGGRGARAEGDSAGPPVKSIIAAMAALVAIVYGPAIVGGFMIAGGVYGLSGETRMWRWTCGRCR